jgi:hypothetical protein
MRVGGEHVPVPVRRAVLVRAGGGGCDDDDDDDDSQHDDNGDDDGGGYTDGVLPGVQQPVVRGGGGPEDVHAAGAVHAHGQQQRAGREHAANVLPCWVCGD